MNGKKAKALRRLLKEDGRYKKEAEYVAGPKVKKKIHTVDASGKPQLHEVERVTLINKSKYFYRQLKKKYKNGEFTI